MNKSPYSIGIYEKAMPDSFTWAERLSAAKNAGYDFIEMSIDESDWRQARLDWDSEIIAQLQNTITDSGIEISSMCLSAHRRYPLGSSDPKTRQHSLDILKKAIDLALAIDIKTILVPGYDVFYEKSDQKSEERFLDGLIKATHFGERSQVILALENTDKYITSIKSARSLIDQIGSEWLQLYGDVGNLVAAGLDVIDELDCGGGKLAGIHIKDALPGVVRKVPLGEGDVPFERIFQKLNHLHFSGPLMLELWVDTNQDPLSRIAKARIWIQEIIENSLLLISPGNDNEII